MNIQEYASTFNDLSRSNRFFVQGAGVPQGDLPALVSSANIPGIQLLTSLWRNTGHALKYPTEVTYNDLELVFFDTHDQKIQKYYQTWIDQIYQGTRFAYKDEYVRDFYIFKTDRKGTANMSWHIQRAYPIGLNEVQLDTEGANQLSQLTVTYAYDQYTTG